MQTPALTTALIAEITDIVFGPQLEAPQPCDVIFVFGGSHPGLWEKTAEAYHLGLGKNILVSGGFKAGAQHHFNWHYGETPEAHVIRRHLIDLGVPAAAISYEDRSTNTLENVLFAREIYDFSGLRRVLAVCKSYGVGRQCRTLQKHLPAGVLVIPYAFDTTLGSTREPLITRENWMEWEASRLAMLVQIGKIYRYGQRGHLQAVEKLSPQLLELVQEW